VKRTLATGLFVAAAASGGTFAQAPAGSPATQTNSPQTQQRTTAQADDAKGEQTLTGCLTSADKIYTLTVLDDSGTPGTTAQTISYTLAPGSAVDLQPHLNKRVTVKGTDAGQDAVKSERVVTSTPTAPAATGTSGTSSGAAGATTGTAGANNPPASGGASGTTPTVTSTAKARVTTRLFNVTDVQPASGSCGA
jgi:hypothetical protein